VLAGHCGAEGTGQLDLGHQRKQVPGHDSRCGDAAAAAGHASMQEWCLADARMFGQLRGAAVCLVRSRVSSCLPQGGGGGAAAGGCTLRDPALAVLQHLRCPLQLSTVLF
jgi:hypothetical protein